jgi:hypothetical protein
MPSNFEMKPSFFFGVCVPLECARLSPPLWL